VWTDRGHLKPIDPNSRASSGRIPVAPDTSSSRPSSGRIPVAPDTSGRPSSGRIPVAQEAPGLRTDAGASGGHATPVRSSEPRILARGPGTRLAARPLDVVRLIFGEAPVEPSVVSITSRAHDDVLEYTHAFVAAYAKRRFLSRAVEPLSLAAYELLSNALGYASISSQVVLQLHESPVGVAVRVTNDTGPARIDMLCAQLDRLGKSAEATFVDEVRRSVSGGGGRPALGLARVVHEAKVGLEVYVVANQVTVIGRVNS